MLGIVIVLFGFDARIRKMVNFDVHSQFFADCFYHLREFENRELLRELVVNSALAARGRILASDLDTANRIAYVEETAHLSALAVHGKRLTDGRLYAKAIKHGAKHVIIVEAIDKRFVEGDLVSHRAVHHSLIQIGGANSPNLAGKHDVVAVMNL